MNVYRLKNLTKNLFYNYLIEMEKCQVDIGTMKRAYFSSIDKAENVEKVRSGGPYHEKHGGRRAETYDDNGFRQCALLSDARQLSLIHILERYWNKSGNVIKFRIQNGFYKNLVN